MLMCIYIILFFYCYCQAAFAKEIAQNADSKRERQLLKPKKYAKKILCSYQSTRELEFTRAKRNKKEALKRPPPSCFTNNSQNNRDNDRSRHMIAQHNHVA